MLPELDEMLKKWDRPQPEIFFGEDFFSLIPPANSEDDESDSYASGEESANVDNFDVENEEEDSDQTGN